MARLGATSRLTVDVRRHAVRRVRVRVVADTFPAFGGRQVGSRDGRPRVARRPPDAAETRTGVAGAAPATPRPPPSPSEVEGRPYPHTCRVAVTLPPP